jgi:hypothetical protein
MSCNQYHDLIAAAQTICGVSLLRKNIRSDASVADEDKKQLVKEMERREDEIAAHYLGREL